MTRFLEEAVNNQDLALFDDLFAPDFLWHGSGGAGTVRGLSSFKALFPAFFASFPDLKTTIEELLVDGAKVTARFVCTASHQSEFMSIPATGSTVSWIGINVYEVKGGLIAEEWSCEDTWGLLLGLGARLASSGIEEHA